MTTYGALGVDIGGTNLRIAFITPDLNVHHPLSISVSLLRGQDFASALCAKIEEYQKQLADCFKIRGIGVGVPGIIDNDGKILSCPNITDMEGLYLASRISQHFRLPSFVEKDTNFLLFGECQPFLTTAQTILGFYVGTGLGYSAIIHGRLHKGSHGLAGELGHIQLKGRSDQCNCGNSGCLELYGAGKALAKYANDREVRVSSLFSEYNLHKPFLDDFLDSVAIGISTAVNILDPDLIIIGGGVLSMDGFPFDRLVYLSRARFRSQIQVEKVQVLRSKAGTYGGCIGAASFCLSQIDR